MKNGLHAMMSRKDYDKSPRANWSKLKVLAKSPAHYRHAQLEEVEDTDAKKLGRCAHLAILEPERFLAECAVWDGGRRAGKEWEQFKVMNEGRELLKEEEYQLCKRLQAAVRSDQYAGPYLRNGLSEASLFWTYSSPTVGAVDGWSMDCKSRVDFITDGALVDVKTTICAKPEKFQRQCFDLGYLEQAAFYSDAYEAATGRRLPYVVIAVEKTEPHVVQVFELEPAAIAYGREKYRDLLALLRMCRSTNSWPGYAEGKVQLGLPAWVTRDDDVSGMGLEFEEEGAAQ